MSERWRRGLLAAVLCLPLLATAAFLTFGGGGGSSPQEGPPAGSAADKEALAEAAGTPAGTPMLPRKRIDRVLRQGAPELNRPSGGDQEGDGLSENEQTDRLYAETLAEAEPLARRFWAAYSRYELGELDPAAAAELRVTASPAFASELLDEIPVRLPVGAKRPKRAELGKLQIRLAGSDNTPTELNTIDLVGAVIRGGTREPLALELSRFPGGDWRVAGLGR